MDKKDPCYPFEYAAKKLPFGYVVGILCENGAGWVHVQCRNGTEIDWHIDGVPLTESLRQAVDWCCEDAP